jgi:hypothetical protein
LTGAAFVFSTVLGAEFFATVFFEWALVSVFAEVPEPADLDFVDLAEAFPADADFAAPFFVLEDLAAAVEDARFRVADFVPLVVFFLAVVIIAFLSNGPLARRQWRRAGRSIP